MFKLWNVQMFKWCNVQLFSTWWNDLLWPSHVRTPSVRPASSRTESSLPWPKYWRIGHRDASESVLPATLSVCVRDPGTAADSNPGTGILIGTWTKFKWWHDKMLKCSNVQWWNVQLFTTWWNYISKYFRNISKIRIEGCHTLFSTFFVLALTFFTSRLLIRGKYRVARDRVRLLVIWSENRINKMYWYLFMISRNPGPHVYGDWNWDTIEDHSCLLNE